MPTFQSMESIIDELNGLLRGELSAVETYEQAAKALKSSPVRSVLVECRSSHERRVGLIRSRVLELSGIPAESSGAWGAFARAVEGGASVLGEKAAIAALEEGEDHGLREYRNVLKLNPLVRMFVERELAPAQELTHRRVSELKRELELRPLQF